MAIYQAVTPQEIAVPTAFKQVADNAITTTSTDLSVVGVITIAAPGGKGALFPQPGNGFYITLWDNTTYENDPGTDPNMEKVLCTGRAGDIFTIEPTTKAHLAIGTTMAVLNVAANITELQTAVNTAEGNIATLAGNDTTLQTSINAKYDASNPSGYITAAGAPVQSVAGRTGTVTLTSADVGLANVDNTSDANKPISTATQTALNAKADTTHAHAQSDITNLTTDLAGKASASHTHAQSDITNLATDLAGKVAGNATITGGTNTKITYDSKGLVTAGAAATTADIADSLDKRYVTDAQLTVIGNTSGTNTGDQTSVTGNAGSTDALKSATTTINVASATAPTSGQILTATSSTAATWQTPVAGGGQTAYNAIVASSGGDYTTLGAALAAASAGWSIFVKAGTYTESAITLTLANITIVGAGAGNTTLNFTSGSFFASSLATKLRISGVSFTSSVSAGDILVNTQGANTIIESCSINNSGANSGGLYTLGADTIINRCTFVSTATVTTTYPYQFAGARTNIIGNNFTYNSTYSSNANTGTVRLASTYAVIKGNIFTHSGTGAQVDVEIAGGSSAFSGNTIYHTGGGAAVLLIKSADKSDITGNTITSGTADYALIVFSNSTGVSVISNTLYGTGGYGIQLLSGGDTSHCVVNDNNIAGYTSRNISIEAGSTGHITVSGNNVRAASGGNGIYVTTAPYTTISGNTVELWGGGYAIYTQSTNTTISGNSINGAAAANGLYLNGDYAVATGNTIGTTMTTPVVIGTTKKGVIATDNTGSTPVTNRNVVYAKNTSGGSIAQGNVVVFKSVAAGNEITTTTTAGDNKVLGVADETIASTASGYICTAGKTVYLKVNGTTDIAIGDYLTTFTAAGIAAKASAGQTAFAIALEAYITDDSNGIIDALVIPPRII